ncbi:MAG TPA: divalent-cation tolerance protein CutA [Candidatus Marinimicrobia bacterium]|jgi:periplasmic divalent cation tolerance protein|nr:divalent-cation tolerance protein CutA [Candidatus Neomarinimicrobiota bacterium]
MKYVLILSTVSKIEDAQTIANHLVSNSMAACVNFIPNLESVYKWKNKVCKENEFLLMIKTTANKETNVYDSLSEIHPYDTPEIITLPIQNGSKDYLDWISESVES